MPTFSAGYYLVGSWSSSNSDHTVELFEYSEGGEFAVWPVTQKDFIVKDEVITTGNNSDPFATHLRGELQLEIIDENNHFRDRFDEADPGQFYLKSSETETDYIGFPVADFIGGQFWKKYNTRTFVFSDGLSILKTKANDYNGYVKLGYLLWQLLNDIGVPFNLNMVTDIQHIGASGQGGILPEQIRVYAPDFVSNLANPTKYDLLMALLTYFGFQIWQEKGEWWIVQRNIRDNAPTLYKRTSSGWTSSAMPSAIEISRSDIRSRQTEDLKFEGASEYVRKITQPDFVFETKSPTFVQFDWENGEPINWPGTGDVSIATGSDGLNFDFTDPVRTQVIRRIIKAGDILNLRFLADYEFKTGISDGVYFYDLAEVRAIDVDGGTDYYLDRNGTWSSSQQAIGDDLTVVSGSYTAEQTMDIDVECDPLPSGFAGVIQITLDLVDANDIFVASDPIQYDTVNVSEVDIQSEVKNEVTYTGSLSSYSKQRTIQDEFFITDEALLSYLGSIEWYDGSEWQKPTDWSVAADAQVLSRTVIESILGALATNPRGYRLQLKYGLDVKLSDIQTITSFEGSQVFIPHYIQRQRSSKRLILQVAEIKDNSANVLVLNEVK